MVARVQAHKPGDAVPMTFERRGQLVSATLRLVEDPRVQAIPAEDAGQPLSDAQRTFRDAWLSSRARMRFERQDLHHELAPCSRRSTR